MNYIKEINAFRNYLKTNSLEAITQALWYVIADYHNSSNWERWIAIDNPRLAAELCISEKTLINHRNKLIQAGLLEYKSQQRKKGSGRYKLLSFELGEVGKKETVEQTAENITPDKKVDDKTTVKNTADKKAERKAVQGADQKADRSDLYKLNETKLNDINTSTTTETKEDNFKNNFDEEFKELTQLYQKCGFEVNGFTADWILDLKDRFGFEWVKNAILEAEKQGVRTKAYVEKILSNWQRWGGMKLSSDNKKAASPAPKKTRFHNFEQRTSNMSNDDLEEIMRRKREEYYKNVREG